MIQSNNHGAVPDLIRDLRCPQLGGPGSGPGQRSPVVNPVAPRFVHGVLYLHPVLPFQHGDLYRRDWEPAATCSATSLGQRRNPYREVSHTQAGLLRGARDLARSHREGTQVETLAARVERGDDCRGQPRLARSVDGRVFPLNVVQRSPGLDPGPLLPHRQRPRIKSGAAAGWPEMDELRHSEIGTAGRAAVIMNAVPIAAGDVR